MERNKKFPKVGQNEIGIINKADESVNIVAFQLDKVPLEGVSVYAWKVILLGSGDNTTIDVTPQYSAVIAADNIQSNKIELELPGGNYYELNQEFELRNIGILDEPQPVGFFYFHIPQEVLGKYSGKLSINIIRAGDTATVFKHVLNYTRIEYSFGVFLGCVPDNFEKGRPFDLSELISNRASVQGGEIVEVWKDAQGKLQIRPVNNEGK